MGHNHSVRFDKLVIGGAFFILMLLLGSQVKGEFFYAIWHVIFVMYFFGQVIYFQYNDGVISPLISNAILLLILLFMSYLRIDFKIIQIKGHLISLILVISFILFIPIFIKYSSQVNFQNLLLKDVYETRLHFRGVEDAYFGYLSAPLSRVVLPALLIISLIKRKAWLFLIMVFMISFIFLIGALKSIFIGMFAAIFFFLGRRFVDKIHLLLYLFGVICLAGLTIFLINENTFLVNSFVRRVLFTPARMDNVYYTFFADHPTYWSHNPIGRLFFEYPLDKSPNFYVGEILLQKEGLNANVGLITEGYFSFGYLGVVLHSIFIGFVLLILKKIDVYPAFFGLIFVYIYYMNTSFLTTLLLTHGLISFLLFAYLFLNKNYAK